MHPRSDFFQGRSSVKNKFLFPVLPRILVRQIFHEVMWFWTRLFWWTSSWWDVNGFLPIISRQTFHGVNRLLQRSFHNGPAWTSPFSHLFPASSSESDSVHQVSQLSASVPVPTITQTVSAAPIQHVSMNSSSLQSPSAFKRNCRLFARSKLRLIEWRKCSSRAPAIKKPSFNSS